MDQAIWGSNFWQLWSEISKKEFVNIYLFLSNSTRIWPTSFYIFLNLKLEELTILSLVVCCSVAEGVKAGLITALLILAGVCTLDESFFSVFLLISLLFSTFVWKFACSVRELLDNLETRCQVSWGRYFEDKRSRREVAATFCGLGIVKSCPPPCQEENRLPSHQRKTCSSRLWLHQTAGKHRKRCFGKSRLGPGSAPITPA